MVDVVVRVDGQSWYGWQELSVRQSVNEAAHHLELKTTDRGLFGVNRWNVNGGSSIEVRVDGQVLFSGYVRRYRNEVSANSHSINITASSAAIDLVESSHLGPYFWPQGTNERAIIEDILAPFGITASFSKTLRAAPAEGFRVGVTEKPFDIIKKLAERNGLAVFTDSSGQLALSDGSDAPRPAGLQRGDYVALSTETDLSQSYSQVIVKAQANERGKRTKANFDATQRVERTITGTNALRYRPAVFVSNAKAGGNGELDQYIRNRLGGDSLFVNAVVKSAFSKDGVLWGVNQQIDVTERNLELADPLRIMECEHTMSNSGYAVRLVMTVPEALSQQAPPLSVTRPRNGFFADLFNIFSELFS